VSVHLFCCRLRLEVVLLRTVARCQAHLRTWNRESSIDLPAAPDPLAWLTGFDPWARRWPCLVSAVVHGFPPGQPFTVRDVVKVLPSRLQEVTGAGHVSYMLGWLWEQGMVVKLPSKRWAVPSRSGFRRVLAALSQAVMATGVATRRWHPFHRL